MLERLLVHEHLRSQGSYRKMEERLQYRKTTQQLELSNAHGGQADVFEKSCLTFVWLQFRGARQDQLVCQSLCSNKRIQGTNRRPFRLEPPSNNTIFSGRYAV